MLFQKSPKIRRFDYSPRYTEPGRQERMRFKRKTLYHPRSGRNLLYYFVLAAVFFLIYLYIRGGVIGYNTKTVNLTDKDAVIITGGSQIEDGQDD